MLSRNVDYTMELVCTEPQISVIANIPENLMIAAGSEWEPRLPFSGRQISESLGTGGGIIGGVSNVMSWANNSDIIVQSLSFQSWRTTAPIEFNLTMLFNAYSSAAQEVVEPMAKLMSLTQPYRLGGEFLFPPGPSPAEPNRSRIHLRIGRFIYINSVLLVNVNNTFDMLKDEFGQPISGQSELTIRTINIPSRQDLESFFVILNNGVNENYGTKKSILGGSF